jgi:hypothetical protein
MIGRFLMVAQLRRLDESSRSSHKWDTTKSRSGQLGYEDCDLKEGKYDNWHVGITWWDRCAWSNAR